MAGMRQLNQLDEVAWVGDGHGGAGCLSSAVACGRYVPNRQDSCEGGSGRFGAVKACLGQSRVPAKLSVGGSLPECIVVASPGLLALLVRKCEC